MATSLAGCGGSEFSATTRGLTESGAGGAQGSGGSGMGGTGGATVGNGGSRDAGSSGGATSGDGGPSTDASVGADTGAAGSRGTGGTTSCSNPTTWYPDNDQDQHGTTDGAVTACSIPSSGHWVTVAGDCNDSNELVYMGEPTYYDVPYTNFAGVDSYDYDCSGAEVAAPNQAEAPTCNSLLTCTGTGFVMGSRTGSGVDPYCGSHTIATCGGAVVCSASFTTVPNGQGYMCK